MTREVFYSLDDLAEEQAQAQRRQADADDANPVLQAKIAARRKAEAEKVDREIAAGLRDDSGEWIETESDEDEDEDDGEVD